MLISLEIKNFDELKEIGRDKIEGNIVFFNRSMQDNIIQTMHAYGGAVNQRYSGASEAAKYGAVGVVVRSMSLSQDDFPHTGAMSYGDTPKHHKIPA